MFKKMRKMAAICLVDFIVSQVAVLAAYAEAKIGYVDLRRAFYEYEKTKTFETELNALTEERQAKRTGMIAAITKLRDEGELLQGEARQQKQTAIDAKLAELQEFDRDTRQQLLNKKNDMFRAVVDDIQKVVTEMGKAQKYDYVLDSRNVMYAQEQYDLTNEVVKKLNK